MARLGDVVLKVRAKNAGPFWLTIDIFCGNPEVFHHVVSALTTEEVASLYKQPLAAVKRFDIANLQVIKFSFPRPVVQGGRFDRDMHGAQWALLLADLDIQAEHAKSK